LRNSDAVLGRVLAATGGSIPPQIYAPSDDTFLMVDAIATLPIEGKRVLDLGTGSGVLGLYCALRGAQVTASDINALAIEHAANAARSLGVELQLIVSDLFSHLPGHFDLVLFNPPYLPSGKKQDRATDGGPGGITVINRFLEELTAHLRKDGTALLLLSSLNDLEILRHSHSRYEFLSVTKRALFFEELEVLRVRLRNDLSI
jgi:release factor glutamine methyltransferase